MVGLILECILIPRSQQCKIEKWKFFEALNFNFTECDRSQHHKCMNDDNLITIIKSVSLHSLSRCILRDDLCLQFFPFIFSA